MAGVVLSVSVSPVGLPHQELTSSTSEDGMIYSRGSADDYDSYAKISGDDGWGWDALLPYMKKVG